MDISRTEWFTLVLMIALECSSASYNNWSSKRQLDCPGLIPQLFKSYTPRGNLTYGQYIQQPEAADMKQCITSCCRDTGCQVALMYNATCYHVQCKISKMCAPLYRPDLAYLTEPPTMVIVKPLDDNWTKVSPLTYDTDSDNFPIGSSCVDKTDCQTNQVCLQDEDNVGVCIDIPEKVTQKQLVVSAVSKEVRLPENQVTLSAFTVPAAEPEHYNYAWSLLSQPDDHTGTMTDQNKSTLKLSNLSEGLYKFRVAVTSADAFGEAYANVSVLPATRINQPPVAIITPAEQIVKLPNTGAVLDGSSSTDDAGVISYHWELQQGPMGYEPHLEDTPTLQLENLIAGKYTFKLTVTDSDHMTSSSVANVTVLKLADYPPSANAGQDLIIHLPQTNITLNGNLSTDDHGITGWEWTASPMNRNKVVDMQHTKTPYLKLSNLEEGMYTFALKVTDESEQSSTAEVHVFVKPPTNAPPKADAGNDTTVTLPETQVTLYGNRSRGDIKIISHHWEQQSGPNQAKFSQANSSVTTATGLTRGNYTFKLTVIDANGNSDSDFVHVQVMQSKNAAPKANAGGDQVVTAPISALIINGSRSSDDWKISQWLWTRDASSLAIGRIINGTDHSPVLMVTNVIPGRYVFKLQVSDNQGLSNEDTVTVIVKPDPELLNLVELTLNIGAEMLDELQKNSTIVKLQMLLPEKNTIVMRDLRAEPRTGRASLVFYVEQNGKIVPATRIVEEIKAKLKLDSSLLQPSVIRIDTVICQNNCSGHGACDEETRRCLCEAFWMPNFIQSYFGSGEANCDWSILYVIIAGLSFSACMIGLIWSICCLCQRICGRKRRSGQKKKNLRYSLLRKDTNNDDDDTGLFTPHKIAVSGSDSESDDVLFEHQRAKHGNHSMKHGKNGRNGFLKNGIGIKT